MIMPSPRGRLAFSRVTRRLTYHRVHASERAASESIGISNSNDRCECHDRQHHLQLALSTNLSRIVVEG